MLQVQNVTVEVGGKNVVQGATFTVMARDKVGIVGRNGAGKTSMFRVLGGENDPAAGKVMRSGAFGYLSQDPRTSPEQEARSAIAHVLSGRNIDADLARLEKLRVVMEKDPSDKNVAKFSKAEEEFTLKGGYSAESEARSIAAGLGLKEDRLDLALGVTDCGLAILSAACLQAAVALSMLLQLGGSAHERVATMRAGGHTSILLACAAFRPLEGMSSGRGIQPIISVLPRGFL
jgi:ABC-type branched-subunit amino acid transport system ATPase component